jgi:hypothetical protein
MAVISLYNIIQKLFVMKTQCVYSEVWTEFLCVIWIKLILQTAGFRPRRYCFPLVCNKNIVSLCRCQAVNANVWRGVKGPRLLERGQCVVKLHRLNGLQKQLLLYSAFFAVRPTMKPIFSQYVWGAVSANCRRLLGAVLPSSIRVRIVIN